MFLFQADCLRASSPVLACDHTLDRLMAVMAVCFGTATCNRPCTVESRPAALQHTASLSFPDPKIKPSQICRMVHLRLLLQAEWLRAGHGHRPSRLRVCLGLRGNHVTSLSELYVVHVARHSATASSAASLHNLSPTLSYFSGQFCVMEVLQDESPEAL